MVDKSRSKEETHNQGAHTHTRAEQRIQFDWKFENRKLFRPEETCCTRRETCAWNMRSVARVVDDGEILK